MGIYAVFDTLSWDFHVFFIPGSCLGITINAPAQWALHRLSGEGSGFIVKILDIRDIVVLRVLHPLDHRCDEVVIWGGEGGSVSYVVLVVEEDTELEGRGCVSGVLQEIAGHLASAHGTVTPERLQTTCPEPER